MEKLRDAATGGGDKSKKRREVKKIYPIAVSYHQETKLLTICLIDCDIKVYHFKMQGSTLHVNDYH